MPVRNGNARAKGKRGFPCHSPACEGSIFLLFEFKASVSPSYRSTDIVYRIHTSTRPEQECVRQKYIDRKFAHVIKIALNHGHKTKKNT